MKTSKVEDKDTIILVMGRGGSDPDANSDFYKLTRLLWERTAYKSVEGCFIAIAKPSLPEGWSVVWYWVRVKLWCCRTCFSPEF